MVRIGSSHIEGILRDPKEGEANQFTTVGVEPDLAEKLVMEEVQFASHIKSTFLRDLLSWGVSVLLFFAIWTLLMRSFDSQSNISKSSVHGRFLRYFPSPL